MYEDYINSDGADFQHEVLRQLKDLENKIEICTTNIEIFKNEIKNVIGNVQNDVSQLQEEVHQI